MQLGGTSMVGADLYNNLTRYFANHLKSLRLVCLLCFYLVEPNPIQQTAEAHQDEVLLRYYATEWERYTVGANYVNRLFTYLNRHWVKRERDEGRRGVYPVYTVSTRRGP